MAQVADISPTSLFGTNTPNLLFSRLVFNTLTEYDHKTVTPKPSLATSWDISSDGTTVTLHLRKDVKFHSGRPFASDDVLFSLQTQRDPTRNSQLRSTAEAIADMSAPAADQVRLRLAHPLSNLFDLLEIMCILDRETFPDLLTGKKIVGTGPFVFNSWIPGSSVTLTKNPSYWKSGLPYLDGAEIRIIPQAQSLLASLRAGQTDLVVDLPPRDAVALSQDGFVLNVADNSDTGYYVGCNVRVPPFDRKDVRQALAWTIDRERIHKEVFAGIGFVTASPWSQSSPAYDPQAATHYRYDPQRAKQLLQAAGVAGTQVRMAFQSQIPVFTQVAQVVQFNLEQAGLKVEAVPLADAAFFAALTGGTLPGMWVTLHGFNHISPATLGISPFPFNHARNASGFSSAAYTSAALAAWNAATPSEAKAAYTRLTDILLDEAFVLNFLVAGRLYSSAAKLRNYYYNMFTYLDLDQAYLE